MIVGSSGEIIVHADSHEVRGARPRERPDASPLSEEVLLRSLRRSGLFASLGFRDLRSILALGHDRHIDRRAVVFQQGDRPDGIYVIVHGRLKLWLTGPSGRLLILALVGPGEAFGYAASMAETLRAYTAQAAEESDALVWPAQVFEGIVARYPPVGRNLLRIIARQLQANWSRLHELVTEPVPRRLARTVLQLARATGSRKSPVVALMQQDLAELLGTTPPTLSRILAHWEARGLVVAGRERIVVTDVDGLSRVAEPDEPFARISERRRLRVVSAKSTRRKKPLSHR